MLDKTRVDGNKIRVAEVILGDETASIILTARNGMNRLSKSKQFDYNNNILDFLKQFFCKPNGSLYA